MRFLNISGRLLVKPEAILHYQPSHCLNCETAVQAHYCHHCGQETAAHMPSAGEFLHEFIGHYIALENKLWKTLALLLFRPGRLTRDYIEGKRARYVQPLRLYLTLSLLFFALFKLGGDFAGINWSAAPDAVQAGTGGKAAPQAALAQARTELDEAKKNADPVGVAAIGAAQKAIGVVASKAKPEKASAGAGKRDYGGAFLTFDDGDVDRVAKVLGPKVAQRLQKSRGLTPEQQRHELGAAFMGYLPYALFAMMPVFALYLKLLYLGSGRLYGEHLLFALHSNAFAFLALALMLVLPSGIPYVKPVLGLWLAFYLPTAMRKVYGGSRLATGVRWMVLMCLHMLGLVAAMLGAAALALIA
jgi:hypothetical protein